MVTNKIDNKNMQVNNHITKGAYAIHHVLNMTHKFIETSILKHATQSTSKKKTQEELSGEELKN